MAQDLSAKKANYVTRLQQQICDLLDRRNALLTTREEAASLGYGTGGTEAISDADLAGFPHLDAAVLNTAFGALDTLHAALITPGGDGTTILSKFVAFRP